MILSDAGGIMPALGLILLGRGVVPVLTGFERPGLSVVTGEGSGPERSVGVCAAGPAGGADDEDGWVSGGGFLSSFFHDS